MFVSEVAHTHLSPLLMHRDFGNELNKRRNSALEREDCVFSRLFLENRRTIASEESVKP